MSSSGPERRGGNSSGNNHRHDDADSSAPVSAALATASLGPQPLEGASLASQPPLSDPLQLGGAKQEANNDLLGHHQPPFARGGGGGGDHPRSEGSRGHHPPEPSSSSSPAAEAAAASSGPGLPPLGKATAFAQFVQQGWEAYMSDPYPDAAFPLQLLCGASDNYRRLVGPSAPAAEDGHLLAPAALRHTHSSPLKYGAPIYASSQYGNGNGNRNGDSDNNNNAAEADVVVVPPPIPLDPFQRSSSTPSSFRQRSTNSAFTDRVPSQRVSYTSVVAKPDSRLSAFDPVRYYARALEDMERTSIEVTNVTATPTGDAAGGSGTSSAAEANSRIGAATRAARFLTDVRLLRRRRKVVGGRDNPATPASASSSGTSAVGSHQEEKPSLDTSVTVITEPNAPETSVMSQSSELSALLNQGNDSEDDPSLSRGAGLSESDHDAVKAGEIEPDAYHRLDSDVDEEEIHFRSLYDAAASESPGTVPSPSYLPMIDERVPSYDRPSKPKLRSRLPEEKSVSSGATSTPSPTRMNREGSNTPRSSDSSSNVSPGTRSSATGSSSSGLATQVTVSTLSSGIQSGPGLSTISETDREVMQANTEGKRRRRGLESLTALRKNDPVGPESGSLNSSTTSISSSNPSGYIALANSPVPLRDGAIVPAYRFFTNSPSSSSAIPSTSAARTAVPLRRSGLSSSPGTLETASASHTTSSGSNGDEVPPKFVSYMDREGASDLTSVREGVEVSTKRGDSDKTEEREDSPAEFVKYPELIYANSGATSPLPRPLSAKGQRHRTARPPRTPTKGLLPRATPSPRGAPSSPVNQHPPPRGIVDHPTSLSSMDHVVHASTSDGECLVSVPKGESLVGSLIPPDGPMLLIADGYISPVNYRDDELNDHPNTRPVRGRTYEDGSVEILKSSTPNSSPPTLVTPEKDVG